MMKRAGLRFALCLALAVGLGACRQTPAPPLPAGVDAQHYDLSIELDPTEHVFEARAVLDVRHPDTLTALPLAFEALTVDSVRVNGIEVEARRQDGRLWVPVASGSRASRIEVVYHGWPRVGFYATERSGQQIVYTDSWPDEGRGWLPGLHHPADPATFALRLRLPRGYEAVASGRLRALDTLGAQVQYQWRLDVPVPLYAFAFAVADFSLTEEAVGDTLPVQYYMLAEDSAYVAQLRRTPQALAFFSEKLGPYAFGAYASVQVPMRFAGMENAGASFLLADLFSTNRAEEVQVHELAHQWFGNRVPIADWADLWLSEGTATYLTTLFYEHADGLGAARNRWIDMAALTARQAASTALVVKEPLPPSAYLSWMLYDKGASVLHLLRRTLGDDAFFAARWRLCRRASRRDRLSEGTATYLTTLFYEHADGLGAARNRWIDMAALTARQAASTALVVKEPLPPSAYLSWMLYDKGASVLHLLRRTLGDDAFFAALRATYRRYAGRPLSTPAFQEMLEAEAGLNLDAFFEYWVYGDDLPTLKTAWDPTTRTLSWHITGDAGTLAGVPFDLQLRRRGRIRYADAEAGSVTLTDWDERRPRVRPVGVMMRVE